jgi:hypothetical protein
VALTAETFAALAPEDVHAAIATADPGP